MALIYFKWEIRRLNERVYYRGFIDGVKFQKGRGPQPKRIEVRYVD